jgi:CheY-like chemotaxis protein
MSMPGMSGIEFAAKVLAVRPDTLIAIVSGFVDQKDADRAHAVGVQHVVRKPNTIAELKELVTDLLPAA